MADHTFSFGSNIRLQHRATGRFLASLDAQYSHPKSSMQPMAVAIQFADDEQCRWTLHGEHNRLPDPAASNEPLQDGLVIRLTSDASGRNLHSHDGHPAPLTRGHQEVTTLGENGNWDDNDNWNLILVTPGGFARGTQIRLQHVNTGQYLHCSAESSTEYTLGHLEVSCVPKPVDSTVWILQDGATDWPRSGAPEDLVSEIDRRLNEVREMYAKAGDTLTMIEKLRGEAEIKSAHINNGAIFADETRKKLTDIGEEAEVLSTGIAAAQTRLQQAADQASTQAGQANASASTAREHEANAKAAMDAASSLADKADRVSDEIKGYETRLAEFEKAAGDLKSKIENLLAGATSVGLGASFGQRAKSFRVAARLWQVAVIICLAGLVAVAGYEVWHLLNRVSDDGKFIVFEPWKLAVLLPIVGPLVWLILHLQRQAATTKRLEEEYAFKEAVSKSFEGYKKQLAEMQAGLPPDAPLSKYYANVLAVITSEPGRIYEKHRPDVSPLTALAENAPKIAKALKDSGEFALTVKPPK